MKSMLKGPPVFLPTKAFWGPHSRFVGAPRAFSTSSVATNREGITPGPSGEGPRRAQPEGGPVPDAEAPKDSVANEQLLFSQAFEEGPLPLDEFGAPSDRPAVRVDISRKRAPTVGSSDKTFGKPRFNVRGLNPHEALHQPSLWQQLLQQEIESRAQRQARTARRTAKVLGASAAASVRAQRRGEQESLPTAAGPPHPGVFRSSDPPHVDSRHKHGRPQGPQGAASTDALDGTAEAPLPGAPADWRDLSSLELRAKINPVETSFRGPQRHHQEALEGAPTPSGPSPHDAALEALGQKLAENEGLESGPQGAPLLPDPSGHAELIEAAGPIAMATQAAGMPRSLWERLPPNHLHTQQRLMRAKAPEEILAAIAAALETVGSSSAAENEAPASPAAGPPAAATAPNEAPGSEEETADIRRRLSRLFGLDPVNAVTAVHRLGRLMTPYYRGALLEDRRFGALMEAAKAALPLLDPQGASNLLWGLTRLEHPPEWLPELLTRCASLSPQMSPHQVATCLYCLGRLPLPPAKGQQLQAALVQAAAAVIPQLHRPLDLTCICAGLARLRVREPGLFGGLAGRARQLLPQLSMSELASVAWAFAAVGLIDRGLFAAVQRRVEAEADICSPGDIVQLAWALARTGEERQDLFDYTLTPIIRGCLPQLNARQLATIASSYAQAGVQDLDLLSDLGVSMLPHLSAFCPQQIATVAVAFGHLGYANREVIGALAQKALKQLPAFSARQLARTVYGLGLCGCRDTRVLDACCNSLQQRIHALRPDGLTQALVGLAESECLSHPVVPALLRAVAKAPERLFAEDCVQLLLMASKMDAASRPPALVEQLQQQMQTKLRSHWCLDCDSLCDLMHALLRLRVSDQHLLQTTMRRLAYLLAQASTREFLRLLGCFAALRAEERLLVRTHIHRRVKVQAGLSAQLERLSSMALDPDSTAALLFACSQLGFADEAVVKMAEGLQHKLETEGEVLPLTSLCHFLWANTEMNINLGWTRTALKFMLARRYAKTAYSVGPPVSVLTLEGRKAFCDSQGLGEYRGGEVLPVLIEDSTEMSQEGPHEEPSPQATATGESLLRAAFVCTSLGEEEHLKPLMEEVATLYGHRLPSDLLCAQQVCLHLSRFAGPFVRGEFSPQLKKWMSLVLGAPRYDVYYKGSAGNRFGPESARLRVKDYNFDAWLSESLIQMKIPHKVTFVVGGVYRVSVAFPLEKHLIDVLTFQDLLAPSSKPTATAELRQRQLTFLGWTVHSVHLRSLYSAVLDRNLRSFVAQVAAACCPQAAEFVSFRSPKQYQQKREEGGDLSVGALLAEKDLENLPSLQRGKFEALELSDDDLSENSPSRRPPARRQQTASQTDSKEAVQALHLKDGGGREGDEGSEEDDGKALDQQERLDADARASIAVAEALQAAYGHSGRG